MRLVLTVEGAGAGAAAEQELRHPAVDGGVVDHQHPRHPLLRLRSSNLHASLSLSYLQSKRRRRRGKLLVVVEKEGLPVAGRLLFL